MTDWISVARQLPEDGETVLVFAPHDGLDQRRDALAGIDVAQAVAIYAFGHFSGYDAVGTDIEHHDVTHWMPLPRPPTQRPTSKPPWSVHPVVDAFVSMPADSVIEAWDGEKWVTLGPLAGPYAKDQ